MKWLGYGVNTLTTQHMFSSFKTTKRLLGKDNGKQIYHFVLSIYKRNYLEIENKEKWCELLCYDVGYYLKSLGYQNMEFIHVNKYDSNVHIHFVTNSINCLTGNKLANENSFYQNLLNYLRTDYQILNWEFVTYN